MNRTLSTSLFALGTALGTVLASPALADVTAADVWANQQALISAAGGTLSGDLSDGSVAPELNFILPQGAGSMQLTADAISMTDNADGSVTISYPSPMNFTISGGAAGEGSFTATMVLTHDSYTATATGERGDIAYETRGETLRVEVTNLTVDGNGPENFDMTGFLEMAEFANDSRITEGNLISYVAQSMTGESNADFTFIADNVSSTSTQITRPTQTNITASLPVGGSNVMNLSQAMRDGLNVAIESVGQGTTQTSLTSLNGDTLNRQETSTGEQTFAMSLGEDGFKIDVDASNFDFLMNDPLIFPGDLEFAMAGISANYDLPLNASDEEQDFRVATSLNGVTMADTIWNLFDPAGLLPRDPAEITFDLTGTGTSGIDLLDFAALGQMAGPPPIEVDQVTIENLRIAALGAEASAQGSMTLDWTDFQTIPGVPRPEGAVKININGANQLMDTLVQMGVIPAEELMMPRMMMGMFATPVGDDMLETVIEVNEQGHVLANGQRLQ
ncbi:DUF2125 domain-containing protein [Pseudooctadecabacter jejudonensis]|uniref:DUF2125 domain-containing protein n=1 Tax=Pseudooctadecabacter jejudonensis TaxID=1391910 RepID=A0A1Y5S972_9RHOB|nr:DUF2125 domain-containing protein [Pseudooctadecabacter jejudonensis]SLN35238.1 hypothetical protein PSJ8397_01765 [Pseudooctadecabacter jejudonensis]